MNGLAPCGNGAMDGMKCRLARALTDAKHFGYGSHNGDV